MECERKGKKRRKRNGVREERKKKKKRKEMKSKRQKKHWKKRKKDLLVFILINLFGERYSFSYGRHVRYINREGVEVVSYNTKLD